MGANVNFSQLKEQYTKNYDAEIRKAQPNTNPNETPKFINPFRQPNPANAQKAFNKCAAAEDTELDKEQMVEVLTNILDLEVNEYDIKAILSILSQAGTGTINRKEFEHLLFVVMNGGVIDGTKFLFLCANPEYTGVAQIDAMLRILKIIGLDINGVKIFIQQIVGKREELNYYEYVTLMKFLPN